jgi:hypothetical protein
MKLVAAGAAVAVLAFGATAIAKHGSASASGATGGRLAPTGANGQAAPQNGAVPQDGRGGPPGMFSPVTGATLAKLTAVATAKYPGTVEHAMRLPDGSYVVHVIRSSGQEVHVLVSQDFKVTGTDQGGPPAGGLGAGGQSGQSAPGGQAAPGTGSSTQT